MHTRAKKQKNTQNLNITSSIEVAMVTYQQSMFVASLTQLILNYEH